MSCIQMYRYYYFPAFVFQIIWFVYHSGSRQLPSSQCNISIFRFFLFLISILIFDCLLWKCANFILTKTLIFLLSFSFLLFSCLFLVCGQPAVPSNAKVKTVSGELGIYEAAYECDAGYELFGPSVTKCDAKRGWEKELPFCGMYNISSNQHTQHTFARLWVLA